MNREGYGTAGIIARWRNKAGEYRWLEKNVIPLIDRDFRIRGHRGADRDITARRQNEARIERLNRVQTLLAVVYSAILRIRDREALLTEACRLAVQHAGYPLATAYLRDTDATELRPLAWHALPDLREAALPLAGERSDGLGPVARDAVLRDRRCSQPRRQESEARFRRMADSAPVLIWISGPNKLCTWFNRQWLEFVGRPMEQELGNGWTDNVHPDDIERCVHTYTAAFGAREPFSMEYRLLRHDGAWRWVLDRGIPLQGANRDFIGYIGSCVDVTESREAADALRESAAKLRAQFERLTLLDRTTRAIGERQDLRSIFQVVVRSLEDHLPIDFGCVCLYDAASEVLTVTCVGTKSAPLALTLAMTEAAHVPIDANGLSRCIHGQLVHEPDIRHAPFPFPQRLARAGLRSLVVAPLLVESKVFGALIVAQCAAHSFTSSDCEFLRQLREHIGLAAHQSELYSTLQRAYDDLRQTPQSMMQQERLRALGQMASGIAHDINNALSPAALYTQSLLERDASLSGEARDDLAVIGRAIDDVANTVARMREFYQWREPQLALAPVELNRTIGDVLELTRPRWSGMPEKRGIVVNVEVDLAPEAAAARGAALDVGRAHRPSPQRVGGRGLKWTRRRSRGSSSSTTSRHRWPLCAVRCSARAT